MSGFLIRGPILLGFSAWFADENGREDTPRPYPVVTPSRVGGVLLPFPCCWCGAVRTEPVDKKKWRLYRDDWRGFSWCPACQRRYVLNTNGVPLAVPLLAGAVSAPALVEQPGKLPTASVSVG